MSRIASHTVEGAPDPSRPLLQEIAQSSPTGRPLNVHVQMVLEKELQFTQIREGC